jgi:membrane protein YdbS with pleckstrin-like domain
MFAVMAVFVGLGLSVFAVFIALLGIGLGMTLTFLAFAALVLFTDVMQLSLWSKLRHYWLFRFSLR